MIRPLKSLTYIAILVATFYKSEAQWETLRFIDDPSPLPWINSISFTDVSNGLGACRGLVSYQIGGPGSYSGAIIRTTDGGITWNDVYVLDSAVFYEITHTDASTAYCVGSNWEGIGIIAKTTDSGINWDTAMVSNALFSVSFPSHDVGYVTGANGTVLKTTNGGANWIPLNSGVSMSLGACTFVNNMVGFMEADTIIMRTTDGGITWIPQLFGTRYERIKDISFSSFNIGYFILTKSDETHHIYKTTDNGNQWLDVSTINDFEYLSTICFPTDQIGYMTGQFQMYKTIDGGLNWYRQYASPPGWPDFMDDVMDLFFLNSDTGFAAGSSQFYRTFGGGDSLIQTLVEPTVGNNLSAELFPNPASHYLIVELSDLNSKTDLKIFNTLGQLMFAPVVTNQNNRIDISELSSGIHILELRTNKSVSRQKFIKQ